MGEESKPSLPADADRVPESVMPRVLSYLEQKGTIELFAQLASQEESKGLQYKELKASLDLSAGSLSRRLEDGQDLGLLDARTVREDGRNKQKYYAVGMGRAIADAAVRAGIYELNRQLLDLKATLEVRRAEIIQRVEEGGREELSELAPRDIPDEDVSVGGDTSE